MAAFIGFLHCDNNPLAITQIHPVLILNSELVNDTTSVVITTSVSKKYSQFKIVSDTCYLTYLRHLIIDGVASNVIDSVAVLNDPDTLYNGRFFGRWTVPDSLFGSGSVLVTGTVLDENGHRVGGSIQLE